MEGDGLAELVFHCVQEMDIDNRMLVRCQPYISKNPRHLCISSYMWTEYTQVNQISHIIIK